MLKSSYGFYLGGKFCSSRGKNEKKIINPATGEVVSSVAGSSSEDVDDAVNAAAAAWKKWWEKPVAERASVMNAVAERIRENSWKLAEVESINTGRVISETIFDIDATADLFEYFAGVMRSSEDSVKYHDRGQFSLIVREPYGVVGAVVPWNFPFLIAGWKIAPALAAGNSIIIKPASLTPLSLLAFCELTEDIIPAGLLNVMPGSGSVCGEAILSHPGISKLSFTGSSAVGKHVAESAAKRAVPATLELGGKSANIVFADADFDRAVEAAAMAIMMSQGQVCSAGSRLLLQDSIYEQFIDSLVKLIRNIKAGDPLDKNSRFGPMISEEQYKTVLDYIEIGKKEGAVIACGGSRITGGEFDKGFYIYPTVFRDVNDNMRIVQEEIFGPVLTVQKFTDMEEAVKHANCTKYGLAGAVWSRDINTAIETAHKVRTGTMWINDYHPVPSGSPFGGFGESGYGREVHKSSLDSYSQLKTIYVNTSSAAYGWY